ncbi:MAG: PPC domain-containing DNA-binding protein [Planctomycetota bacterium]
MRHHEFGDGRILLRLDPGEEVIGSLAAFAAREQITAGYVTGLGSVERLVLGFLDPQVGEYVKRTFEEPMEVAQLTGSISMDGDRPFVHAHAVVAPRELLAYAGHVHEARVGAVMELFVTRLPGRLERRVLPDQPFLALFLPGEAPPEEESASR